MRGTPGYNDNFSSIMVFGVAHRNVGLNVGMRERISSTSCFRRDIELFIAQTILLHPYRGMTPDPIGLLLAQTPPIRKARRHWEAHDDNLEMRDAAFLRQFKRGARMSRVQISIAKTWRGMLFRRRFLVWKNRRQLSRKVRMVPRRVYF